MTETTNIPQIRFPQHGDRRVWLISSGDSPIGLSVARQVLAHGDCVVSGVVPSNIVRDENRRTYFEDFLAEVERDEDHGWKDRFRTFLLDIRKMGECQAAVAEAVNLFGRLDIVLCCTSQAIVGSVEELSASPRTLSLVRDQFETNYFGPVNIIKAALPQLRSQKGGHFLVLTGITAHLGTPGLGVYCASEWALEGFCDSIAYEVAPFNIKVSILQCSMEICILTNLISSVPPILPAYSASENNAPLFRNILDGLVSRLPQASVASESITSSETPATIAITSPNSNSENAEKLGPFSSLQEVVTMYAPFSAAHLEALTLETVHAITAIGGHENPPSRHIIGQEGVAAVKEKLKTVSEELEDFVQSSYSVNIHESTAEEEFNADIM
ncbi:short chain dehydrogenase/reductase family protein [Talaromyces stipitatus ATCC 10500]|uniref:Short chain dehydrogenase/reductase family protein n=1 Tax=Talaromyces stipitatus (strain ATCC 10500 / CBS 375.48 / QM 6759 / NRRL 1006) TaxID=441959 RepID=B8M6C3_TALSN|nr:short chain dehydrogenase/reductase family protein [Talaromyces stipitatus ATCC 10500]EED19298.1 short chain dehydrogenase/reductase family protein [Talaromyces stipitatus ATCC 10500]